MSNILLPRGRMRRTKYLLFLVILSVIESVVGNVVGAIQADGGVIPLGFALAFALLVWPHLMIGIQRAHDIGSAFYLRVWWTFTAIVIAAFGLSVVRGSQPVSPIERQGKFLWGFGTSFAAIILISTTVIIFVVNIAFLFKSGQVGPNKYGDDPRGRAAPQVA